MSPQTPIISYEENIAEDQVDWVCIMCIHFGGVLCYVSNNFPIFLELSGA